MNSRRIRLAVVSAALLLLASVLFAGEGRTEDRVALVKGVDIAGSTAVLRLTDDSTLEAPVSAIRVRSARSRSSRSAAAAERSTRSATREERAERESRRALRADDLKTLVDTSGAQALLLRVRYDDQGRIRSVRGDIFATETEASAAMTRRTEARAAVDARRKAPAQD